MTASATEPQPDAVPSDAQPAITQPAITEPLPPPELPPEEPPPAAPWRSRSAQLLIGVPIAGALLVWLAISTLGSDSAAPPEAEVAQSELAADTTLADEAAAAVETAPVTEAIPGTFPSNEPAAVTEAEPATEAAASTEAAPATAVAPATEAIAKAPAEAAPAPAAPAPPKQPDASLSAVNEVIPKVPQSALETIRGTVRVSVRVTVNKAGSVVGAAAEDGGPSRYFERLSVDASRKWTFAPANGEGQRTQLLKFNFTRDGVTARVEPDETP